MAKLNDQPNQDLVKAELTKAVREHPDPTISRANQQLCDARGQDVSFFSKNGIAEEYFTEYLLPIMRKARGDSTLEITPLTRYSDFITKDGVAVGLVRSEWNTALIDNLDSKVEAFNRSIEGGQRSADTLVQFITDLYRFETSSTESYDRWMEARLERDSIEQLRASEAMPQTTDETSGN